MYLDEQYLEMVLDIIKTHIPEYDVWMFGSRVHGRALKKASDIDLCVRTNTSLTLERIGALKDAFDDSNLPYRVDVVDWASTSDSFRCIIEQEHEVIWEGKPQ